VIVTLADFVGSKVLVAVTVTLAVAVTGADDHGVNLADHGLGRRHDVLDLALLLEDLGPINLKGINWVIVGGESGPGARPMEAGWVRNLRAQCRSTKVAFFFKQWGGRNKKAAGRLLRGRTYDELPAFSM